MKGSVRKKWVGSIGKNVEKLESLFAVGRNIRYCNRLWKTSWSFLEKVKDRVIIWSSNCALEYKPKRIERKIFEWYLYMHVQSSIILSSKKVEAPKGPLTDESINKMWCICVYNGVLFSLRNEGNSDLCYNTDEPWGN